MRTQIIIINYTTMHANCTVHSESTLAVINILMNKEDLLTD